MINFQMPLSLNSYQDSNPITTLKSPKSVLIQIKPLKRRGKRTFKVDATPIYLDYNTKRNIIQKIPKKTKYKMELLTILWILNRT